MKSDTICKDEILQEDPFVRKKYSKSSYTCVKKNNEINLYREKIQDETYLYRKIFKKKKTYLPKEKIDERRYICQEKTRVLTTQSIVNICYREKFTITIKGSRITIAQ